MSTALDVDGMMPRAPELFAGRYLLGRTLKKGNGVVTIDATDTKVGTQVVQKVIDPTFRMAERGPGAKRISVSDTDPGLSRDDLGRIFMAFERGLETSVRHREGTGLGLHICQKLAELIDVRIKIDTAPGHGSTFALTFGEGTL